MCMLLSESTITTSVVTGYFKRLKRIVPLYLAVVILTIILGLLSSPLNEYRGKAVAARYSAIFCSNFFGIPKQADYFDQV